MLSKITFRAYLLVLLNYSTRKHSSFYLCINALRVDPSSDQLSMNLQLSQSQHNRSNQTHMIDDEAQKNEPLSISHPQFVFSDIDGTLVHYHPTAHDDASLLFLPPSATGLQAHISTETLRLCQVIRRTHRAIFVLVSGMRTKTLFQRLPFLPRADAYCSENGGRIFYPVSLDKIQHHISSSSILLRVKPEYFYGISMEDAQEFGLVEDVNWRRIISRDTDEHIQDYSSNQDLLLPSLQILATSLEHRNFTVDKTGYSTCIRLNWKQQRQDLVSRDDFDSIPSSIDLNHLGLQCSRNLGCIDFFPRISGKKNCCEYIADTTYQQIHKQNSPLGLLASSSFCICDDDNDIPLAQACKKVFLPTLSSETMREMAASRGEQVIVTEDINIGFVGFSATEEALRLLSKELSHTFKR